MLIERVRDPERQQLAPGSTLTIAMQDWDHYIRSHLRPDAAHLAKLEPTDVAVLIEQLRVSGPKWSGKARQIEQAVRKAGPPKLRVVKPDDPGVEVGPDMDRDPATWGALAKSPDGRKAPGTLSNAARILELDPVWQGRIAWDEHGLRVLIDDQAITDATPVELAVWMDRTYGVVVEPKRILDALRMVANSNPVHPIRDYLGGLRWDGVPRLDTMADVYLGALTTSERHRSIVRTFARKWMIAAVARAFRPGCKVKAALLLLGDQNVGKTPVFQILGGAWYTRSRINATNKDGQIGLAGVWIWEVAEIGGWFKSRTPEEIKAFLDQETDRYRSVFGQVAEERPRGLVFGATDNDEALLRDPTGASRWWPVQVGRPDLDALRRDRDQLWAEATTAFNAGGVWHLVGEEEVMHREVAERHSAAEPWQDVLLEWLYGGDPIDRPDRVTTSRCLERLEKAGRYAAAGATPHNIGRWLRSIGWVDRQGNRAERAEGMRSVWVPGPSSGLGG